MAISLFFTVYGSNSRVGTVLFRIQLFQFTEWNEYRNRALGFKPNDLYRCPKLLSGNIFYVEAAFERLKIYKFDSQWAEFKVIDEGAPLYSEFGLAFHGGKIFILGGKGRYHLFYNTVSDFSILLWWNTFKYTLPFIYSFLLLCYVSRSRVWIYPPGIERLWKIWP